MNKKGFFDFYSFLVIIVVCAFSVWIVYELVYAFASGTENITVNEKWVKYHGGDAKYLISSTDGEVYEITDSYVYWRFDSSNLYAYLEPAMRCTINYQGFRFPFLSDYKNIIKATCVT